MIAARTICISIKWSCLKEDTWHKKKSNRHIYFRFSFCFKHSNLQRNGLRLFQRGIYWQHLEVGAAKKFPFGFFFSYVDNPSTICLFRLLLPPNSEHEGRRNDSSVVNDIAWRTGNVFVFPVLQEWIHPRPASCLSPLDRWTQENNK